MRKITGNKLLVRALKEEGVDTIFGYPGACTIDISDELYKQDDIRIILPRHEQALVRQTVEGLGKLPGVQVYAAGEKDCQSGVVSFRLTGRDPGWVAEALGQRGIAVRAGMHCAPLAHATGGTEATGTVRVSFSAFNTAQEADRFLRLLGRLG